MSIIDFAFAPGVTTVHAGDTVTWINTGKAPHTATATGGAFSTGVLRPGTSGSHTFSQAGTYTYFCAIHPFMHGSVVVLAAASPTHGTPSASHGAVTGRSHAAEPGTVARGDSVSTTGGPIPRSTPVASAGELPGQLPYTGFDLRALVLIGASCFIAGLVLRHLARRR